MASFNTLFVSRLVLVIALFVFETLLEIEKLRFRSLPLLIENTKYRPRFLLVLHGSFAIKFSITAIAVIENFIAKEPCKTSKNLGLYFVFSINNGKLRKRNFSISSKVSNTNKAITRTRRDTKRVLKDAIAERPTQGKGKTTHGAVRVPESHCEASHQ